MAKNQPVNANTQVGIANGTVEGYANLADLATALGVGSDTFATVAGQVITFASGATLTVPAGSTLAGTVLTTSDGNSVDLSTLDTDTFTTLAGQTLTLPDGQTITIPNGSTLSAGVLTTSDGNTIDLNSIDTDTFATLAAQTITFANGDTITIPDGSSITGTVITTSDGNTIDVAAFDTDTFATLAGDTITFANGATYDLSTIDTDTFATITGNTITVPGGASLSVADITGSGTVADPWVITDTDGDTATLIAGADTDISAARLTYTPNGTSLEVGVTEDGVEQTGSVSLPVAPNRTDLFGFSTAVDYGLLLGLWRKPLGRAATQAEVDHINAFRLAVNVRALAKLLPNKAAEPTADGISNADGSFGWFSRNVELAALADNNGARASVDANNPPATVPDGTYIGQTAVLEVGGGSPTNYEVQINGNFRGVLRDSVTRELISTSGTTSMIGRPTEQFWMRWNGNAWVVTWQPRMLSAVGWQEQEDGTISWRAVRNISAALGPVPANGTSDVMVPLPFLITNPADLTVVASDHYGGGVAGEGGQFTFTYMPDTSTTSMLSIRVRNLTGTAATANLFSLNVDNIALDYAAYST